MTYVIDSFEIDVRTIIKSAAGRELDNPDLYHNFFYIQIM